MWPVQERYLEVTSKGRQCSDHVPQLRGSALEKREGTFLDLNVIQVMMHDGGCSGNSVSVIH